MTAPPGAAARPNPSTNNHPRRPPAHKSVSLRHSPPANVQTVGAHQQLKPQSTTLSSPNPPASDKANPPSSVSPMITNKQSSGESSDAGKWFENSNNYAANGSFVDNDPPFFLRNSSSSGTPPEGHETHSGMLHPQSTAMPYRPGIMQLGTDGSSTEDFRSVIDDLTVANKKLKQKLRKYEKLYDAHLQDEKLFEVRFHGLPDHKKKELEDTLRKFASNLGDASPGTDNPSMPYPPTLDQQKTVSSTSRFAESGYASMSVSGQNSSTALSGQNSDRKMSKSQYSRQQQSVRSYLQDIPQGLMPKQTAPMTEKFKKKLVVRRLEQVFAGKRSMPGSHTQQIQQEEVAQSAAMADRQEKEAIGQLYRKEGLREARIMPVQSEDEDIAMAQDALQKLRPNLAINEQDFAGSGSPNQRPTRPLDLDPFRAQVPAENMDYIRHLGFTPPNIESEDVPEDGHGWIYLNLLINMAQLHTINVTPDFVKEAVTDYSSKFDLSHDGRKIRWKGGHDLTKNSDSSSEQLSGLSPYYTPSDSNTKSPSKRLKTSPSGESGESSLDPDRERYLVAKAAKERDQDKLAYSPLFFRKEDSEDEDDYEQSSSNSPFLAQQRGDSSGFGSSAMQSSSSRKKREDGPMIFYNKARFCTDLSGDRQGVSVANATTYKSISSQPLGATSTPRKSMSVSPERAESRGPFHGTPMDSDNQDSGRTSSEDDFGFSPDPLQNNNGENSPELMQFEASGLGGVQPEDNFSIRVRRSQSRVEQPSPKVKHSRIYPHRIRAALDQQSSPKDRQGRRFSLSVIKEELLSAARKSLPSSTLPPASFLPFDSTSSGDVDSDLESNVSSNPSTSSSSEPGPANALPLLNVYPHHADDTSPDVASDNCEMASSEDEDDSSDSDGSIDMLATARQLDPTTIRASEREYDAELADRLQYDIPAGSSAATAGGGSGFNSPAGLTIDGTEDGESTMRRSNASVSTSTRNQNLKRARTSDSFALRSEATQKKRST